MAADESANKPVYSIVMPVFNEQENLPELHRRLTEVMKGVNETYELVFVDDGSRDQSREMIRQLNQTDPCCKLAGLSRNFGHQRAVSAGLALSNGQAVIVMDSDLQDAPEVIPDFITKWKEGYKVVYAIRRTRKEGFFKQLAYRTFYRILKATSDTDIPLDSGDFSLMDRRVVDLIKRLPEKTRFVRGLRAWVGFNQIGIPVDRDERFQGKPKYNLRQLMFLALSGLMSFSVLPLRFATALGVLVSTLSFLSIIVVIGIRIFTTWSLPGFAATASILLFLSGVQLLTIGVLGEYIGKIFDEVKDRPLFILSETIGLSEDQD
ncbi:MAG: glycosyltransferase family 2 protein [Candidatus Obscuribacterales bacterium]